LRLFTNSANSTVGKGGRQAYKVDNVRMPTAVEAPSFAEAVDVGPEDIEHCRPEQKNDSDSEKQGSLPQASTTVSLGSSSETHRLTVQDTSTKTSLCTHRQTELAPRSPPVEDVEKMFPSGGSTFDRLNGPESVVFTLDAGFSAGKIGNTQAGTRVIGLENIVSQFRSSCSSVADSASTGTCTASTISSSQLTTVTSTNKTTLSVSSGSLYMSSSPTTSRQPVRVSFVPLDPEQPLEDQHGGRMDVILHKLTEDILCLSQLAVSHPCLTNLASFTTVEDVVAQCQGSVAPCRQSFSETELDAVRRVHRLCQFRKEHPECCLVDDPICVQTLMSRADIDATLQRCLKGVLSTSGVPVSTPKSILVTPSPEGRSSQYASIDEQVNRVRESIQEAGLTFPIIMKPLIAAGTKASHAMAVLMDERGIQKGIVNKAPCICQEYSNHDAMLYKVYVLGDHVSVHKRRSLPNLPRNVKSRLAYVEFDSQRPYPRLSDFGFDSAIPCDDNHHQGDVSVTRSRKRPRPSSCVDPASSVPTRLIVTAEEVQPIVDALKKAFGLEMFGFDVLISSEASVYASDEDRGSDKGHSLSSTSREMLVVDVNYFPSYKEVPNFPALLAQYLTDRAMDGRRLSSSS